MVRWRRTELSPPCVTVGEFTSFWSLSQAEGTGLDKPAYQISLLALQYFPIPSHFSPPPITMTTCTPCPVMGIGNGWENGACTCDLCSQLEMLDLQVPSDGLTLFLGALGLWPQAAVEGTVPE